MMSLRCCLMCYVEGKGSSGDKDTSGETKGKPDDGKKDNDGSGKEEEKESKKGKSTQRKDSRDEEDVEYVESSTWKYNV